MRVGRQRRKNMLTRRRETLDVRRQKESHTTFTRILYLTEYITDLVLAAIVLAVKW